MLKNKLKAKVTKRPKKMVIKEDSGDEDMTGLSTKVTEENSEDEYADYQPVAEDVIEDDEDFDFEKDKSHSKLLSSLDKLVETKKKRSRIQEKDVPLTNLADVTLGSLYSSTTSRRGEGKKGLTFAKVLAGIKDKDARKKATDALTLPRKKNGKKEESMSLTTSLEKPVVKRIERAILYDHVKKDVSKWNAVVYHNRLADNLVFPLESGKVSTSKKSRNIGLDEDFVPHTNLEIEVAKILHGPEYVERKQKEVFGKPEAETQAGAYVKSIEEALEKHSELSRLRALQSYEMAKAKRRNKIKSKKYHRLLRRDKIRKQLKEFEELQETDPAGAMLKLEELDKARVQERMSLKHRNTSKWAKMQAARAKYNRDSMDCSFGAIEN